MPRGWPFASPLPTNLSLPRARCRREGVLRARRAPSSLSSRTLTFDNDVDYNFANVTVGGVDINLDTLESDEYKNDDGTPNQAKLFEVYKMYHGTLKKFADRIKFIQKHDLKENNYSQVDLICGDPFQNYIETSTLDKKNSNYFGKIYNNLNDNFNLNYEFSIDNNLNEIQYTALGATITKNNFVTTFNYIEESGLIGSSNILENETTFNFDEQNFITFRTRNNREIDLTEYYDLIYEYRNDCLVAGIKYNKTYYQDRDLEPTEDFMLSIKLVPLTAVEQNFAN